MFKIQKFVFPLSYIPLFVRVFIQPGEMIYFSRNVNFVNHYQAQSFRNVCFNKF